MSTNDEAASGSQSQLLTGPGPAIALWIIVVLALGYGVVKTVETALALFTA
ncbi:hypothetical protein HJD18_00265 [Thermoleophilia bacterium SCSIO 60948]|nr:hypothetical protein HJD18_00265 [Thermoleophilia bacterium SCSIO 60948]